MGSMMSLMVLCVPGLDELFQGRNDDFSSFEQDESFFLQAVQGRGDAHARFVDLPSEVIHADFQYLFSCGIYAVGVDEVHDAFFRVAVHVVPQPSPLAIDVCGEQVDDVQPEHFEAAEKPGDSVLGDDQCQHGGLRREGVGVVRADAI